MIWNIKEVTGNLKELLPYIFSFQVQRFMLRNFNRQISVCPLVAHLRFYYWQTCTQCPVNDPCLGLSGSAENVSIGHKIK